MKTETKLPCLSTYIWNNSALVCPPTFDGWTCWDETRVGTMAHNPCPIFIPEFIASEFEFKKCPEDGTWFKHPEIINRRWSNHTTCVDIEEYQWSRLLVFWNVTGHIIAVASLILSIVIFCAVKTVDCPRIVLHKQLFLTFILSNLIWLGWLIIVIVNEYVLIMNPWWCKALHLLVQYFLMVNYFWMFCKAFHLQTRVLCVFIRFDTVHLIYLSIVGWLLPLVFICLYAAYRMQDSDEDYVTCWTEESEWNNFIVIPVVVNFVFNIGCLLNILRVVVIKLINRQQRLRRIAQTNTSIILQNLLIKGVRATSILITLLGFHYVMSLYRPEDIYWQTVCDTVSAAAAALQGFWLSVVYCFCNWIFG